MKIEHAVYQSAKMFGRHFDDKDELYSHITRQSIDVLKTSFKADVSNEEWLLIKALKPVCIRCVFWRIPILTNFRSVSTSSRLYCSSHLAQVYVLHGSAVLHTSSVYISTSLVSINRNFASIFLSLLLPQAQEREHDSRRRDKRNAAYRRQRRGSIEH